VPAIVLRLPDEIADSGCHGLNTGYQNVCVSASEKLDKVIASKVPPPYAQKQSLRSYYRHTRSWLSKVDQVKLALKRGDLTNT